MIELKVTSEEIERIEEIEEIEKKKCIGTSVNIQADGKRYAIAAEVLAAITGLINYSKEMGDEEYFFILHGVVKFLKEKTEGEIIGQ